MDDFKFHKRNLRRTEDIFDEDEQEPSTPEQVPILGANEDMGDELTPLDKEELGTDVSEILGELEKEEALAEMQDLEEDARLDAEGFVDGTDPILEGDDGEMPIEVEDEESGVDEFKEKVDNKVQEFKDLEEWRDATSEHDKEWFAAVGYGVPPSTNPVDDGTSGIDVHKVKDKDQGWMDQEIQKWNDLEDWREATSAHDKEWFAASGYGVPDAGGMPDDNPEPGMPDDNPEPGADISPMDGNDAPGTPTAGIDGIDDTPVTPPSLSPTERPTLVDSTPTTGTGISPTFAPIPLSPTTSTSNQVTFAAYGILVLLPLVLICCCWRFCCGRKSGIDTRGEYRAVAAQYGNMSYDNTFSEVYSDDEDDGGFEDDTWGKSGRRTLEMSNIRNGHDTKLSISEMNG